MNHRLFLKKAFIAGYHGAMCGLDQDSETDNKGLCAILKQELDQIQAEEKVQAGKDFLTSAKGRKFAFAFLRSRKGKAFLKGDAGA